MKRVTTVVQFEYDFNDDEYTWTEGDEISPAIDAFLDPAKGEIFTVVSHEMKDKE